MKTHFFKIKLHFLFIVFLCIPYTVSAESQSLTVTPPLFQISVEPGGIWQSTIKVANSNNFPLTVYTQVVNFVADGEEGKGTFVPLLDSDEGENATLAEWIEVPEGPHTIPVGQTGEISFFIEVPVNAAPGGHFAAILVETEPPKGESGSLALNTSQAVTSLFFVRIEGNVMEKGDIRELSVLDRSIELPEAEFSLRFENKGNVHIQPKGHIIITNMWGTERGIIPVNNKTNFGNVLPGTIRDFKFTWKGERSFTDIGRYKAVATLAYGVDGVQTVTAATYFWILPIKAALITISSILIFIWLVTKMVRAYIRRMLTLAGVDVDELKNQKNIQDTDSQSSRDVKMPSYRNVALPLKSGVSDLTTRLHTSHERFSVLKTILIFVWNYKFFFVSILFLIGAFIGGVLYIQDASRTDRTYEVIEKTSDGAFKIGTNN